MKELPKAQDKVAGICEALRRGTLEPAQQDAARIIAEAEERREQILQEADQEVKVRMERARHQIAQEQALFRTSMEHAGNQAIALIKQRIQESLFQPAVMELVDKGASAPDTIAGFLNGVIQAIEKEGTGGDIQAVLPKTVPPATIMPLLMKQVQERLKKEGSVSVGGFKGGVQIRLKDKNMVLDISDEALQGLLLDFLRESFHSYLFTGK